MRTRRPFHHLGTNDHREYQQTHIHFPLVSLPGCYPDSTAVGKIERRLKVLYQGFYFVKKLRMTTSQHCIKHICLSSIISNVTNNEKHRKTVRLTSFQRPHYNPFQSSSTVSIHASFCISSVSFLPSFHALIPLMPRFKHQYQELG